MPILGDHHLLLRRLGDSLRLNPTNACRPDTSVNEAQGKIDGAALFKINNGSFKMVGQNSSGPLGQTLFVIS